MVISNIRITPIWHICQKTENTLEAAPHLGCKGSVVYFAAKYLEPQGAKLKGQFARWKEFNTLGTREVARPLVIEPGKVYPLKVYFEDITARTAKNWNEQSQVTTCFFFEFFDSEGRAHLRSIPALLMGGGGGGGLPHSDAALLLR